MYGINEIKKQNVRAQANVEHANIATYCALRNGGVLLKAGNKTKTIEAPEASAFLQQIRDKGAGFVKQVVLGYFEPALA